MAQRQWRSDDTSKWVYGFGNGSDGAYAPTTSTDAPIDSACTGTSGDTALSATNAGFATGQIIMIHQTQGTGAGNWELNKIDSYTTGTITTKHALCNTYGTGAQVLVIKQYSSILIDTGVTLSVKAWNGTVGGILAWFCRGTTTITGSVTGMGKGFRGGTQYTSGRGWSGEGQGGVSRFIGAPDYGDPFLSGGGGGDERDVGGCGGGGGGNAADGTNGGQNASGYIGEGGLTCGTASIKNALFGGGGGVGGSSGSAKSDGGAGGTGGGLIFIFSKLLTITGSIAINGNTGAAGSGGGGGGAGGSGLLKFEVATLGTNLMVANAGAGGGPRGGAGSVGRIHADYSVSLTGTTTPTIDTTNDPTIVEQAGGAFLYNIL